MAHHLTRKSFKTTIRDRPKHSGKIGATETQPRRQGAGRGNVGQLGCEMLPDHVDPRDPNFDVADHAADTIRFTKSRSHPPHSRYEDDDIAHLHSGTTRFTSTLRDYTAFKSCVRDSAAEYLVSRDLPEFIAAAHLHTGTFALFHQDLPFILIKQSFDLDSEARVHFEALLLHLFKANLFTRQHVEQSFRRLYSALPDLLIDTPGARQVLHIFAQFCIAQHMAEATAIDECEAIDSCLADARTTKSLKEGIAAAVDDFFALSNASELIAAVDKLCATIQLKSSLVARVELVKALVSRAMDLAPRDRQLVSTFLASHADTWLKREAVEAGLGVLLERVEDLSLDVPDVLGLLSCFLARAVIDEALAPAFLVRADLLSRDMGAQVLTRAQWMLARDHAVERLTNVWLDDDSPLSSPHHQATEVALQTEVA